MSMFLAKMKNILIATIFLLTIWKSQSAPANDLVVSTESTTDPTQDAKEVCLTYKLLTYRF